MNEVAAGTLPARILALFKVTTKKSSYPPTSAVNKLHRKLKKAGTSWEDKVKVWLKVAVSVSSNVLPSKSVPESRLISPGPVESRANQLPSGACISGAKSLALRTSTWPPRPPTAHPDRSPVSKSPFTIATASACAFPDDVNAVDDHIITAINTSNKICLFLLLTSYSFPSLNLLTN